MRIVFASALVAAIILTVVDALTEEARQAALDEHNTRRSKLALGQEPAKDGGTMPKAKNMYKLKYSAELEKIAQKWADGCVFSYSPYSHRLDAGENIYMSTGNDDPAAALRDAAEHFWKENVEKGVLKNVVFTNAVFGRGVGHFTQMAWAATTELGCGVTYCPNQPMTFVVCNYKIAGNTMNDLIYEVGDPCTKDSDCTTYEGSTCIANEGLCKASKGTGGGNPSGQRQQQQNLWAEQQNNWAEQQQNHWAEQQQNHWAEQQQNHWAEQQRNPWAEQQQNPWAEQQRNPWAEQQRNPWAEQQQNILAEEQQNPRGQHQQQQSFWRPIFG